MKDLEESKAHEKAPKTTDPGNPRPSEPTEEGILSRFSSPVRRLLGSTPEKDWPRIRAFLIESEEEGEILDLLPEINRVMKYAPSKLMGRVGRTEITPDEVDRAYREFHDAIHGVREALGVLLGLAGLPDSRLRGVRSPRGGARTAIPPAPIGPL
jgi:hypothetical protein